VSFGFSEDLVKLGSFEIGGKKRLGAFEGEWVIDLNVAHRSMLMERGASEPEARADSQLPIDLISFIKKDEASLSAAKKTLDFVRKKDYRELDYVHPLSQITFRASHRPPKIVCTGTNYEDYRKLIGIPFSPVPLVFLKSPSAIIGHEETISLPAGYGIFYHEWEFSCVISKRCRRVPMEKVNEVIFGYTILDDITARSLEATNREFQPWGKNIDTFAPMGPWIVTPDEMPKNIYELKMVRRLNGKVECESNTSNMRFGFGEIIAFVTSFWTLEPGDVVTTATPPAGPFEAGDVIEAEIEGIGVLRNPVEGIEVDPRYAHQINLQDIV
jgi:2-keto-4-pentenoate hydratase/2-oxohepta-3-ene-1,7-dioic acid hydratase in catechol pathway